MKLGTLTALLIAGIVFYVAIGCSSGVTSPEAAEQSGMTLHTTGGPVYNANVIGYAVTMDAPNNGTAFDSQFHYIVLENGDIYERQARRAIGTKIGWMLDDAPVRHVGNIFKAGGNP